MQRLLSTSLFCLLGMAAVLSSCNKDKYEDQFEGTWTTVELYQNGAELSSVVQYRMELQGDKDAVITTTTVDPLTGNETDAESTGTWSADSETMKLTYDATADTDLIMDVMSVTSTALEISFNTNGDAFRLVMKK